jgi:tetratricopeptide (TPR) repeat protein
LAAALVVSVLAPGLLTSQAADSTPPAKLTVTSSSAEAKSEFWAGLHDVRYLFPVRAAQHFAKALDLDPDLGLARVMHGAVAVNYTPDQRQQEYDAGVAAAAKSTMGEALVALAWRERALGHQAAAVSLLRAATEVYPGDGGLAYDLAALSSQGQGSDATVASLRAVLEKFPDEAEAYNVIAYTLWQSGDHAGGLAAAQTQLQHAARDPNPHDSYAELLAWNGQLDEAVQHYQHAIAADSMFTEALAGIAEVRQLQGRGADARALYAQAIGREQGRAAQMNHRNAIAVSYLYEGNWKQAMSQLATVAQAAAAESMPGFVALAHREMAELEGMFGNGKAVAGHLAAAQGVGNPIAQNAFAALAYGGARQLDSARAAATRVSQAASSGNANLQQLAHLLQGFVALQSNAAQQALDELNQADTTTAQVKEMIAECQKRLGNKKEAQALRDAVLNDTVWGTQQAIARMRARKI